MLSKADFLRAILGSDRIIVEPETETETLIAETVRAALWSMYKARESPVYSSALVNWVQRKLELCWELWDEEGHLRRRVWDVLREGRTGSLDFLGDVIILRNGRCLPSPTRTVQIDQTRSALISGAPTDALIGLVEGRVYLAGASRVIQGSVHPSAGIPVQERASFLGADPFTQGREELVEGFLEMLLQRLDWTPATISPRWLGLSGFSRIYEDGSWEGRARRFPFERWIVEVYRERLFNDRYFRYWLIRRRPDEVSAQPESLELTPVEFFRVAIVLAEISGEPAQFFRDARRDPPRIGVETRMPAVALRLVHLLGGTYTGFSNGRAWWNVRRDLLDTLCDGCRNLGFEIVDVEGHT